MKNNSLLNLALLVVLSTAPQVRADYSTVVLDDAPLVYYRFEEAAGATTIADSSGNGLDIDFSAPAGTTEIGVPGVIGSGVKFNADGFLASPLTLDPSAGDFTIEAIINPDRAANAVGVILANGDGFGTGRSNLVLDSAGSIHSFSGAAATTSGVTAENGTPYHIILTYDQSAAGDGTVPTFRFYVDGVAMGTGTAVAESANGEWVIGANKSLSTQLFSGLVDEVAIYDSRLDDPNGDGDTADSRVAAHYKEYLADSDVLVTFESNTAYIDSGSSADLTWLASPALTALTLSDGVNAPVDVLGNTTDGNGALAVSPTVTTTYTLEGTSPAGTETLQLTIVVDEAAVIDSFTTNLPTVAIGGTVELSWAVTNGVSVEIDNGVGTVDPIAGSVTAIVNSDTTFTLTATNSQGLVTATVTVTTAPGDPTLIAHWRVGETAGETGGTSLVSETGATFIGTFVGAPTFDTEDPAPVPGGSSASIAFDGANSYVDILGYNGIGGAAARTVAFWFKGSATQTNNNATLVSWGANATSNRWDVRVNNNPSGLLRTEVQGSGSNSTGIIADDTWHHCAAVFDGATIGDIVFYIDGQADPLSSAGGTAVDTATDNNVRLGSARVLANRSLTGKMDDIRIYNRALGADEVLALFEPTDPEPIKITSLKVLGNGDVELQWTAPPGDYSVEFSLDLQGWLELDDPSIAPGETPAVIIDSASDNNALAPGVTRIYYRIRETG